jgi:hypothetical protein
VVLAATGDSRTTAALLTVGSSESSKTVNLADEKVEGELSGWGVYYFKVSLKRGTEYTFWTSATSGDSVDASVGHVVAGELWTAFSGWPARDAKNVWLPITAADWEYDEELTSGTYYLVLSGEVDQSVTLNYVAAAVTEPIPVGTDENPATISVGTNLGATTANLHDGFYYFNMTLTLGNKYKFWTEKGTQDNLGFDITIQAGDGVAEPLVIEGEWTDEYNNSKIVVPAQTGRHQAIVAGVDNAQFTFKYQVIPARLPVAHTNAIVLGALTEAGVETSFIPFARNNPFSGFFDPIIDEQLFKVTLTKDSVYVFETFGDEVPDGLVMELYDAKGTVLLVNRHKAQGDSQTGIAFKAPATGDYWVGVCQDLEEPTGEVGCVFSARKLAAGDVGQTDDWDAGDDAYAGAAGLAPLPGAAADSAVTAGAVHGPHTLGLTDWADWFRIDARKEVSYKLQAVAEGFDDFTLEARIYTLSGTTLKPVATLGDLATGGTFTATVNGSYYIHVFVRDGQGVSYGPYNLYSLAYKAGASLGMLQVNIGGPTAADGASWSLVLDGTTAPKYPPGATILVAGAQTVKFTPVTDWATPANQAVTVNAGATPTVVSVNYNDTSDPKDDLPATATALTPTNKSQKRSHSLWEDDAADWFKVTFKTDSYYTFTLSPYTGAPWITLYRADLTTVVGEGTSIRLLPEVAGTYYVKVGHEDSENSTDSAYTLNYLAQTVGTVKFEKAAYTYKEGTPTALLKVLRSAKDGRIRVRYQTQQITAVPGTDYKPVKGYLEWANGDSLAKTISVPLIPDLRPGWDSDRTFSVLLETVPEGEVEADELVPPFAAPTTAVVTLTEITKKAPGKLGFSGFGSDAEQINAFANAKAPAVTVGAGGAVTLWIARADGADGAVSVTAGTVAGTALAGTHFDAASETLEWEAGDLSPKPFTVATLTTEDPFLAAKAFTVKLTAASGGATLGAASVAFQIRDPSVARTLEEWVAAGGNMTGGALKPSVAGAWFFDEQGLLRCAPLAAKGKSEVTVTLTGPGTLRFAGELSGGAEGDGSALTCMIGSQSIACGDGAEVVRYVAKGAQTVKFTVTRGAGSEADAQVFGRFADWSGQPFEWTPLRAPTLVEPLDKAVLSLGNSGTFRWKAEGVGLFRIYIADTAAKLNRTGALISDYATEGEYCTSCSIYDGFAAGKAYYWRVDSVVPGDDPSDPAQDKLTNPGAAWSFTIWNEAQGAPLTEDLVVGALSAFAHPDGAGYQLIQGLSYLIGPLDAPNGETFKATGLPQGLVLKTVGAETYLAGIPAKTNTVTAIFQASVKVGTATVAGTTFAAPFSVAPAGLAAGTFNGLLTADAMNAHEALASVSSYTAAEAGGLSAKVMIAGKTYAFTGSGFSESIPELAGGQPGLLALLTLKSTVAGKAYTNTLTVAACRGAATDPGAVDALATAELVLWIPAADNKSAREVTYSGKLVRDNSKVALALAAFKSAAGYYAASLPVAEPVDGAPAGAGYVTLTLAATGSAKLSGVLADGTAWTASAVPGYVSDYEDSGAPALLIPVYTAKAKMAAGGWLVIASDPQSGLPVATGQLDWYNADANATRGGTDGFGLALVPVGGYYDTIFSLQTYYLDAVLTVGAMQAPAAFDATTYTVLLCTPDTYGNVAVNVVGDTLSTDARALAKDATNTKLYDFENSTNPGNLALKFTRATGLFSGTFGLWYGNALGTLQKEQVGLKFQGVLTPCKASGSGYEETPGLGFYQIPEKVGTRTWLGSALFTIDAERFLPDWSEGWGE